MKEYIPMETKKPFKGIATIQLFDKDGNIIQEVVHENTYNKRLQYIDYFDSIPRCMVSGRNNNMTSYLYDSMNAASTDHYFKTGYTYSDFWSGGSSVASRQLYATLWLTNKTADADPMGYPNGCPVAVADTAGVASNSTTFTAGGYPNLDESYYSNDRLHLVFDFNTNQCNVSFDSLWLYPSRHLATCYSAIAFYNSKNLMYTKVLDPVFPTGYYTTKTYHINATYRAFMFVSSSSAGLNRADRLLILDTSTGTIASDITFSETTNLYVPFYYSSSNNRLYSIYAHNNGAENGFTRDTANLYSFTLLCFDLTSGTRISTTPMAPLLSIVASDYGASSITTFYPLLLQTSTQSYLGFYFEGVDALSGSASYYYNWYSFDALTESFNLVKYFRLYSAMTLGALLATHIVDSVVFLHAATQPIFQKNNNCTAIKLSNGDIVYDKCISAFTGIYSDGTYRNKTCYTNSTKVYPAGSTSTHNSVGYIVNDIAKHINGVPMYSYTSSSFIKLYANKAPWTTHNKLPSTITKTKETTMKIQYDVIWDSLEDVVIPGML